MPPESRLEIALPPHIAFDAGLLQNELEALSSPGTQYSVAKRSIDARSHEIKVRLQLHANAPLLQSITERTASLFARNVGNARKVAVVGCGPAGMFAALKLIELGLCPIVFERGKNVRERRRDLAAISKHDIVNPESNYCFGEGGAGTYSDGKLYTRSGKRGSIESILEIFVAHGATDDILVDAHPHIGTNKLPNVVSAINQTIVDAGGAIHFNSKITNIFTKDGAITGLEVNGMQTFDFSEIILATGHSASDIFHLLRNNQVQIEAKPFALGVRVEHEQSLIDKLQYKRADRGLLPAASYTLKANKWIGKKEYSVFSFCMCPGGYIVPAATSPGQLVVNGMSPSRRDSKYANSGIVVNVDETDWKAFAAEGPLAAWYYQQSIEQAASAAVGGSQAAPAQLLSDFASGRPSSSLHPSSYHPGLKPLSFADILPEPVFKMLSFGFDDFNNKIKGYKYEAAQAIGIESRTSSPVRVPRDDHSLAHPHIKGLYPCGEGAGYAGGIVSAAIDGQRCAQAVALALQ